MATLFDDDYEYTDNKRIDEDNELKKKLYDCEDSTEVDNVGKQLLEKVKDKQIQKEVSQAQEIDPFYALKLDVYDFFRKTMTTISLKEELLKKVDRKVDEYLDMNPEIDFDQLMQLRRTYSSDAQSSRDSILSLFRPTPGSPSLLADNLSRKDDNQDEFEKMYDKMSSKDLEKWDLMLRTLENLKSNKKEEE